MTFALCLAAGSAVASAEGVGPLSELPSRFAELDGVRVHYREEGSGSRALVFIHGWGSDAGVWRQQVARFSNDLRALYVDLPGHGRSDKPEIEYSMDYLARAVDAVVVDAGVDKTILVGHSNGVPVARQVVRRYPEKARALVAVEGSFRPLSTDPAQIERLIEPFRGPAYLDSVELMVPESMPAELRAEILAMMKAVPQHVLVGTLEGAFDPEIWGADPIAVPTLVLLAESPFWTSEYEDFVRGIVPDLDYRVLQGVGHFLQLESPDLFNSALTSFLRERELVTE